MLFASFVVVGRFDCHPTPRRCPGSCIIYIKKYKCIFNEAILSTSDQLFGYLLKYSIKDVGEYYGDIG